MTSIIPIAGKHHDAIFHYSEKVGHRTVNARSVQEGIGQEGIGTAMAAVITWGCSVLAAVAVMWFSSRTTWQQLYRGPLRGSRKTMREG